MSKYANAQWQGAKEGKGTISTETKALDNAPFTFATRFGDAKDGTNPEELIAAAHSGCFTMQLSFLLSELNYVPTDLSTEAVLTFEDGTITKIHLELKGDVPGITNEEFQNTALKAKQICPVSKVLNAEITLTATLA